LKDLLNIGKNSIYREGYGIVAKLVMRDKELSPEAKAIYSYICSFAGSGTTAFPSAELMMHELNMGDKRFYKFRKELVDKGYITIFKQRNGNRREKNIYHLESELVSKKSEHSQFESVQNESVQFESVQLESVQNEGSNNNSLNNNSLNNNSIKNNNNNNKNIGSSNNGNLEVFKHFEKCGFIITSILMEQIAADIEVYSKEWLMDAAKEAMNRGKINNYKYVLGILQNWQSKGRNGNGTASHSKSDLGEQLRKEGIGISIEDM
jgi:DnaD/phage-associated family protein